MTRFYSDCDTSVSDWGSYKYPYGTATTETSSTTTCSWTDGWTWEKLLRESEAYCRSGVSVSPYSDYVESLTLKYRNLVGTAGSAYKYVYSYKDLPHVAAGPRPAERLKQIIQSRVAPAVHGSRRALPSAARLTEVRARETLCRVIGQTAFRRFLKNGFVSVKAKSGRVYQIFPAQGFTRVYLHGELIEKLCVVLGGDFPPTDSLIMRYLLILNDEDDFRNYAIRHSVTAFTSTPVPADQRPLPEIFASLKAKAAA